MRSLSLRSSRCSAAASLIVLASLLACGGLSACAPTEPAAQADGGHGGGKSDDPGSTPPDSDGGLGDPPGCPYDGGAAQKEVFFTRRLPDRSPDMTIEDEIVHLTQAAIPGSRLRVAVFNFNRMRVADALIAAQARGVDVGVVADERNQVEDPPGSGQFRWNDAITRLRAALPADRMIICGGADVPRDGGGCMGTTINHNKFVLASELCDGSRGVVAQSSANFTDGQLILHNNMVVIRDDAPLFAAYDRYWDDLATDRRNLSYYRQADGDSGTRVFFFPRPATGLPAITGGPDPDSDTIYTLLDRNVNCAAGAHVRFAESTPWPPRCAPPSPARSCAAASTSTTSTSSSRAATPGSTTAASCGPAATT
jgi:hypothetical protein